MISKFELLALAAGLALIIGAAGLAEYKLSKLEKQNATLSIENKNLVDEVAFYSAKVEALNKMNAELSSLVLENKTVEVEKKIYVEKLKKVDIKTTTATEINALSDELELGWQQ